MKTITFAVLWLLKPINSPEGTEYMLHIKSEKKCKTSHLSSQNEIFFVFIKISTCVKIIGYLQRYGLMFKTSLQLSLT